MGMEQVAKKGYHASIGKGKTEADDMKIEGFIGQQQGTRKNDNTVGNKKSENHTRK